jgi:hypothetical protein
MATEMIRPYTGEDKPPLIDLLRLNKAGNWSLMWDQLLS